MCSCAQRPSEVLHSEQPIFKHGTFNRREGCSIPRRKRPYNATSADRGLTGICAQDAKEALAAKETERAEAAAQLERRMSAMEAVLAARRTPVAEAKPEAARGPGADLRFHVWLPLLLALCMEMHAYA
jgi:hypothetical protein